MPGRAFGAPYRPQSVHRQTEHSSTPGAFSEQSRVELRAEDEDEEQSQPRFSLRHLSVIFRRSTIEASPVNDAETIVYATSVSSEEMQRRKRLYLSLIMVLLITIAVYVVVGVVVSQPNSQTVGEASTEEDPCQYERRNEMS